jgi:hypothetical protein
MKDYCLFIPYVNRPDLLKRACISVQQLGPSVIDNSEEGCGLPRGLSGFIHPRSPLTFAQTMNFGLQMAKEWKRKYCLFMHSDAEALKGHGDELLRQCRVADDTENDIGGIWGCIFTAYDALVALNVKACMAVGPWDVNLPWYLSDCDYYRRLRLASYLTLDSGLPVKHEPSQTLKADPKLRFLNSIVYPLHAAYYRAKWGGDNGKEVFTVPFNGRCPEQLQKSA